MKKSDLLILLGFCLLLSLFFLIRLIQSLRKKNFVKTSPKNSIRAMTCLEEEGYRFSRGKKTINTRLWIDDREFKRSMQVDLIVSKGLKKYVVVVSPSPSRPDRVAMQKELMLLRSIVAADGLLIVTLDASRIQRVIIKTPERYVRHFLSKLVLLLMLIVVFIMVWVFY